MKTLELQITQTWHPKVIWTDGRPDGRSGPTTRPAFAKATQVKIDISLEAGIDMIFSKKRITKALISLRGCAGWSGPVLLANPRRQVFSRGGPVI